MLVLTPYRKNQKHLAYNPFRDMEEMEKKFFEAPFGGFFHNEDIAEFKTDITDRGEDYLLEADLPGFDKSAISLNIDGDMLTVTAERHSDYEDTEKKNGYVRCERSFGKYSRSFDISEIDKDNIKAKLDNGVLSVTLPKKKEVLPEQRKLEIE